LIAGPLRECGSGRSGSGTQNSLVSTLRQSPRLRRPELTWQHPGFKQTDRDPVVCGSWQDAKAYIAWLNGKVRPKAAASSDGPYRLPSESEWEYAARARTSTQFWWGNDDAAASNHAWYKDNSSGHTHPVEVKLANAFGLYDAVGNVWQWTQDCFAESYSGAPTDGRANETGVVDPRSNGTKACMRVDRGASWFFRPWALRSATRERNPADYRDTYMGFRAPSSAKRAAGDFAPYGSRRAARLRKRPPPWRGRPLTSYLWQLFSSAASESG
jgi:formylglycine-generating enzyme required for sulfatase activity